MDFIVQMRPGDNSCGTNGRDVLSFRYLLSYTDIDCTTVLIPGLQPVAMVNYHIVAPCAVICRCNNGPCR